MGWPPPEIFQTTTKNFKILILPSELEAAVFFPEEELNEADELLLVLRLTIQNKRIAFNKIKKVTATATPTTTSMEVGVAEAVEAVEDEEDTYRGSEKVEWKSHEKKIVKNYRLSVFVPLFCEHSRRLKLRWAQVTLQQLVLLWVLFHGFPLNHCRLLRVFHWDLL